ncbi:MAG: hypothetical protein APF84_16070 [Gracilibacter sp. BRH_c7a]|nr:MAG: hypothetical protein APF84_16070 [Gracilibacter sp. BRH_c7a]
MPKTARRRPSFLVILGILFFLVLILWNFRANIFFGGYDIVAAQQGLVKHEKIVEVVFANTESVLTAPAEGQVILPQEEGRRFARGEVIAKIIPTGVDHGDTKEEITLQAPNAGLFYASYDNLEHIITPENLMNMDLNGLLTQISNTVTFSIDQNVPVSKHSPIGKIVNNLYPTWMFVHLDNSAEMVKDDTIRVIVGDYEYNGTVMKVVQQPQGAIIRFTQYVRGSTEARTGAVTWIVKSPTRGMVVPSSALAIQGEEQGVYVAEEGLIRFRSVKVLDDNGTFANVQGIREGDKVISNPKQKV